VELNILFSPCAESLDRTHEFSLNAILPWHCSSSATSGLGRLGNNSLIRLTCSKLLFEISCRKSSCPQGVRLNPASINPFACARPSLLLLWIALRLSGLLPLATTLNLHRQLLRRSGQPRTAAHKLFLRAVIQIFRSLGLAAPRR